MKFCISRIYLGRYKLDMLDDNNQIVQGTDGGPAYIMIMLTKWLFEPEHTQYLKDQRASSNDLGNSVVEDMKANKQKYLP